MVKVAPLVASILLIPAVSGSASTTWVHATDPTCGGNSPCYATLALGIDNVDNGGMVIVMASAVDKIVDNYGKQNITVRGVDDSVLLTGNVNLAMDEPAVGWTLQDINFTLGIVIRSVADSITIDNVGAAAIKLGEFDQDVTANMTLRNVTMQQDTAALISIIATDGADIGGAITIENCTGIYAININTNVSPAGSALITADIAIRGNDVLRGGGINVRGIDFAGSGSITGSIEFSGNLMSPLTGKFGVTLFGEVTGGITGPVSFHNNHGGWLAVLTTSTPAGTIGDLSFTSNTTEAIEVVATGALIGPIHAADNQVIDLGGGTGLGNPLMLFDGSPLAADVVVENNTAPEADVVVRSSTGQLTGTVRLENNSAGLMTLDSQNGDLTMPFTVSGNTLPSAASPLSTLTIRTLNGGDSLGGSIIGNSADRLTVNFGGALAGDLTTSSNTVGADATFIAPGGPGAGIHTVSGNDFQGFSYFDGVHSTVRFNRIADRMTVVAGATVDGRYNWWGCNAGANRPGCSTASTGVFQFSPHLVLRSAISCIPPDLLVSFDVLEASDAAVPDGNITPGTVAVSSTVGVVTGSPANLVGGAGTVSMALPQGASEATVTSQLDSEAVDSEWPCAWLVFSDGFESGNTSAWSQLQAMVCECLEQTEVSGEFGYCLECQSAPSYTRDQLRTRCADDDELTRAETPSLSPVR